MNTWQVLGEVAERLLRSGRRSAPLAPAPPPPRLTRQTTDFAALSRASAARRGSPAVSGMVDQIGAVIARETGGDVARIDAKVEVIAAAIRSASLAHARRDLAQTAREGQE